jgi:hypothetical protein
MPAGEVDPEGLLVVRQLLAELAALPPLQREAIVRSAVRGASREQVASELGVSTGAVRGLVYRARAALRGAVTALTPPWLLAWLSGTGPGPERVSELGTSAGGTGIGAALLKGGAVAVATGTLIGAVVVHNQAPAHHHRPRAAPAVASIASQPSAQIPRQLATTSTPGRRPAAAPERRSSQSAGGGGGLHTSKPSSTGHARVRQPAGASPPAPASSAPAPSAGQTPASLPSASTTQTAPTATTASAGTGTTGTESQGTGTSTSTTPPPSEPAPGGSGEETKSPPPGSGSSGGSSSESGKSGGLVGGLLNP